MERRIASSSKRDGTKGLAGRTQPKRPGNHEADESEGKERHRIQAELTVLHDIQPDDELMIVMGARRCTVIVRLVMGMVLMIPHQARGLQISMQCQRAPSGGQQQRDEGADTRHCTYLIRNSVSSKTAMRNRAGYKRSNARHIMGLLIAKYAVTALIVVVVSEVAKRSDRIGALIASLPLVTVLAMIWLHLEKQPTEKIANHAYYTFWYVLPTMPMFLLMPWMLRKGFGFWTTLGAGCGLTVVCFIVAALVLKRFGIGLMS